MLLFSLAQNNENKIDDPFDVSKQLEQISKYGVPTIAIVNDLKTKADALYESESWKEAITAYKAYAEKANWLANLLSQCVQPYYSAGYDDRKSVPYSFTSQFLSIENKANELKSNRNVAYVRMGISYKRSGDIKNAVAYLYKGLQYLDVKQRTEWELAKNELIEILGFND